MIGHQTTRLIVARTALALGALLWLAPSRSAQADGTVLHAPPIPYTWQISAADEASLYAHVKALRYGDSLPSVKAALGTPMEEEDIADKKGGNRARSLLYAIRRVRPGGGNFYDQDIRLIFDDQSHRLLEIWYTNLLPLSGEITQAIKEPGTTEVISYVTRPPMP